MTVHCPACAAELPDGMRFCGNCGRELALRCAACGTPAALPDQRFCGNCGSPLRAAAAQSRERRLVTVLFCDLVAFTTYSESRDPEDVRDVLEHYFTAARTILTAYDGTIEKFIGDAVMAVWGAPLAREDDAERAVRAALEITEAVQGLSARLAIPQLRVRVGILTGEASVEMASAEQGMLVGDVVNTAARIQSVAQPGTVLVDETTRLACERTVVFEDAGEHELKGKSAPLRTWRAVRVRSGADEAQRGGVVQPPLVGRDEELQTIKDALHGLLAPGARMSLVSVIGDAGLGKSRLAGEFVKYADGIEAPIRWYRGRVLSFGEGSGVSALAEMVRMRAAIAHEDAPERQRELLGELIDEHFAETEPDRDRVLRAVARLLELDDGRELIEQGQLFSAWRLLFERLAARGPVALVFEELQSADQALLDFIAHLLEWARTAPILSLALGRPDPRLESLAAAGVRVDLAPLSDAQMDELVAGTVQDAPPALLAAVRAEGGGIPLYAVETLRALADAGVLEVQGGRYLVRGELEQVDVAPTLHALVASRLDRLQSSERQVLAGGAVLGERFTAAGAAAIAGIEESDARLLLGGLVDKAFLDLDRDPRSPLRGRYGFLQGVVRRVTLGTLSRRDLKRGHLAAAEHLAADPSEPERASALASHLLAAEQADPGAADAELIRARARVALREAAERAAAVGALEQALSLYDRAASLSDDDVERAAELECAASVAHRAGDAHAAAERYRAAGEVHAAAGRERERMRLRAHELRALRYVRPPAEMLPDVRDLYNALRGEDDAASALAGGVLAFTLYQTREHEEALEVATRAIEIAQSCDAVGELLQALGAQATALAELGRPQEAIEVYRRTVGLAFTNDPRRVAPAAGNLALTLGSVGRFAEAAAGAREAIAAAERTAERFFERWGRLVLGRALCSLGDWDEATAEIESVLPHIPPLHLGMATAPLVVIALARGAQDRVRDLVTDHDRRYSAAGSSVFESDFRLLRAAVLVPGGDGTATSAADAGALAAIVLDAQVADYAEWSGWLPPIVDRIVRAPAEQPLQDALGALRSPDANTMKQTAPVLAQAMRLEAHLAVRAGDVERAGDCWQRAVRLARECGLAFETAVIELERAEHGYDDAAVALAHARGTFMRLRATPWLARAEEGQAAVAPPLRAV